MSIFRRPPKSKREYQHTLGVGTPDVLAAWVVVGLITVEQAEEAWAAIGPTLAASTITELVEKLRSAIAADP